MNSLAVTALLAASRLLPRRTPVLGSLIHNSVVTAATGAMVAYTVVDLVWNGGEIGTGSPAGREDSRGADTRPYEERTRTELYELARQRDIAGRSGMDKDELIAALRRQR